MSEVQPKAEQLSPRERWQQWSRLAKLDGAFIFSIEFSGSVMPSLFAKAMHLLAYYLRQLHRIDWELSKHIQESTVEAPILHLKLGRRKSEKKNIYIYIYK